MSEIYRLEEKIAEIMEQVNQSPAKELQDAHIKLKQESDRKESKIANLTKVIQQVWI